MMLKMTNKSNCTFTLTTERIADLDKMSKETHLSRSKLIRLFVYYFTKNNDQFLELIKKANDIE